KFGLKYQLRYKRCKSDHFLQVGPTKDTTLRIKSMHPKGKYCIQATRDHSTVVALYQRHVFNAVQKAKHVVQLLGTPVGEGECVHARQGPEWADLSLQVQCRASRYPISIDCSWTYSPATKDNTSTNFITTYRVGMEDSKPCNQSIPGSLSCSISDFINVSKLPHALKVTAIQPRCTSTTILGFVPDEIIKPDPPVNIHVSRISEDHLQVQWNPPGSWPLPETYKLKYQLRYKRCKSKHYRQVGPTEDTTLTINLVHSKGKYCIQVNAQHYLGYGKPKTYKLKYQLRYKLCNAKHFLQMGPTLDTTLMIKSVRPQSKYCIQVNAQHFFGYGEPSEWSPSTIYPNTAGN
ncbi:PREDICTED: interleukin-27 subunit beta-like, partial [Elephantulus edwardii]|uniref:interleukin-27 subunit beta-like n=1 Tax=Elephantulus edwardii TaxID=28737 RepID=UPI0003F0A023